MTRDESAQTVISQVNDLAAPERAGNPLSLLNVLRIKRLLTSALPDDEAFEIYRNAMTLGPLVGLEKRRIGSLLEAAKHQAKEFHVLHQGGEHHICTSPEIVGPGRGQTIEGLSRTTFVACFANAVAHSRSAAIQLGSEFYFDVQGKELGSVPTEMAFDPLIFRAAGEEIAAIVDRRPTTVLKFDRAWSLMGINSVSFGHWIVEGLLQFLSGHKALNLEGVPLLIDAQMPRQHRESLEVFGRGRFPIIEVPRWMRAEVDRLWVVSNWCYSPHLIVTDQGLDPSHFVGPFSEVAKIYQWASTILDDVLDVGPCGRRTFLARSGALHRRITNFDEIEAYLSSQGFSTFYPERHSFRDQARALRESNALVVQNGSASVALAFSPAKTKVCYLSHPAFPFIALLSELLKHLDVEFKVISGPFEKVTAPYVDQSDYRIPLDGIKHGVEG